MDVPSLDDSSEPKLHGLPAHDLRPGCWYTHPTKRSHQVGLGPPGVPSGLPELRHLSGSLSNGAHSGLGQVCLTQMLEVSIGRAPRGCIGTHGVSAPSPAPSIQLPYLIAASWFSFGELPLLTSVPGALVSQRQAQDPDQLSEAQLSEAQLRDLSLFSP